MAKIQVPSSFSIAEMAEGSPTVALKNAGAKKGATVSMVPFSSLKILPGFNPRVVGTKSLTEHRKSLMNSILANGYYDSEPFHVFVRKDEDGDSLYVRGGHNRHAAVEMANKKKPGTVEMVPVLVDGQEMTEAEMTIAFATGNKAKELTMYENGIVMQRLSDLGLSKKEIQQTLGLSDRAVLDLGVLMTAPQEIIDLVTNEDISATLAIDEIKTYGPEKAAKRLVKANAASPVQDELTGKKKKVTKKAVKEANAEPTDDDNDGEPVFEHDLVLDRTLDIMQIVMEQLTAADSDSDATQGSYLANVLLRIVQEQGGDDLVAYAVAAERYVETGLVYLELVELPEDEPAVEPAGAIDEQPAKPKRERKPKKEKAAPAADLVDQAAGQFDGEGSTQDEADAAAGL
jgi:hypothetical protein